MCDGECAICDGDCFSVYLPAPRSILGAHSAVLGELVLRVTQKLAVVAAVIRKSLQLRRERTERKEERKGKVND